MSQRSKKQLFIWVILGLLSGFLVMVFIFLCLLGLVCGVFDLNRQGLMLTYHHHALFTLPFLTALFGLTLMLSSASIISLRLYKDYP